MIQISNELLIGEEYLTAVQGAEYLFLLSGALKII